MGKPIDTSYFNEETFQDHPVDPKVQAGLAKLDLTDQKMVSFKDVIGGAPAFEDWAANHYIPGFHSEARVQARYLTYYTHLKTPAPKSNGSSATVSDASTKSTGSDQPATSSSAQPAPLTAKRALNPKLKARLQQADFKDLTQVISYQEVAKHPQSFTKWAQGQGIPLNLDHQLVQMRYWKLYQQVIQEYQAKQQVKQQQQSLAQAMADSKTAQSQSAARVASKEFAASVAASNQQAQSVAASRSAVQASRAQRSLERQQAHSVKAQLLAKRQSNPPVQSQASNVQPPTSVAHNPFKDPTYGGLVKPKHRLTSDHDRLVSGFSKELASNDPVFEALQEDPGDIDDVLFPGPSDTANQAAPASITSSTHVVQSQAAPNSSPKAGPTSASSISSDQLNDDVDLFGDLFDGDGDSQADESVTSTADLQGAIDPVSKAAFQSALDNYQAQMADSTVDSEAVDQPMDVTGHADGRQHYYDDANLFMEIPKEIDRTYGPYRVSRKLNPDEHSRLTVDSHVLNGIRDTFDRFLGDGIATELLHAQHAERNGSTFAIPDVELQMTYLMYMQTAAGVYSQLTWQQWCAGKVLDRLIVKRRNGQYGYKARSSEMLKQYHSVNSAIYQTIPDPNNHNLQVHLPDVIRWYLYLSTKTPNILTADNQNANNASVKQQLTQMTNSIDLLQTLCTVLLSTQDESQWQQLLLGDQGKKMSYLIKQLRPDLVKPRQTTRRTEITRYRNKVADPYAKRNQN